MIRIFGPMPSIEEMARAEAEWRTNSMRPKKQGPPSKELKWKVWERDNFTCVTCGARRDLTLDHILPTSRGGATSYENLQTMCGHCNSKKGAKVIVA